MDEGKVVNLSKHALNTVETTILKKCLNFVVAPKTIPTESIICNIEDCIQNLSAIHKETIR